MSWWNPVSWLDPTQVAANEAAVAAFAAKVKGGVQTSAADAEAVYNWIGTNGPAEIKVIDEILQVVILVAGAADPRVAAAVAAINVLTIAVDTVVAAKAANENIVQALADVYKAYKNMQVASANAVLAHVS